MKIRTGYVSNSSSSSFCIVGVICNKNNFKLDFDAFEDDLCPNSLEYEYGISNYYDDLIIGKDINSMDENITLSQFKNEIFENLKKIGYIGNKEDIQIFIDGGYDG